MFNGLWIPACAGMTIFRGALKKQATIRMGEDVIAYFKSMSEETGIPYQSLINLYLRDCVAKNRKLDANWTKQA